jgi:pimeloyl-[acyl-carrier protein] methyl ester esterase
MLVDALPFFATLMMGPNATVEAVKPMAEQVRAGKDQMSDAQRDQMMRSMATAPADLAMIKGWSAASDRGVVANAIADDMTLDLRPGLATLTTPIVLLHPDYSTLGSPPGVSDQMYRTAYAAAPSVKVVEIAPSLHFIMLDQPAKFDAALDAFLAN